MICCYDIGNEDFEKNGDAVLTPISGSHTQVAGGGYDISFVHPIDPDGKWRHLVPGAIVKAPVPVETIENSYSGLEADIYVTTTSAELRDGPSAPQRITYQEWGAGQTYSVGDKVTVTTTGHRNFQCIYFDSSSPIVMVPPYNSSWWKQIPDYTSGATVLVTLPTGTELYLVEDYSSTWIKAETKYGMIGYVQKSKVRYDRHVTPEENQPREIRDQLFRIEEPVVNTDNQTVTVTGKHVSYDFSGDLIQDVSISQASPAMAIARLMEGLMIPYRGTIATNLTSDTNGTYTGEIKGKNGTFALLDPDKGIVHEFNARYVRDNWDLFVMQRTGTDRGYRLRYGVNTRGITLKQNSSQLINRVVPVAKDSGGKDLYLPELWVDSPRISYYPVIKMARLTVQGQVGKDKGTGDGSTWTESDLLDEMRLKASEQFSVSHVDEVVEEVTIQIEQLDDTAEYAWLKGLKSLLLYDVVNVIDERIGIERQLYVSQIEYDIIREKIIGIKLSNIQDMNVRTVAGYNVMYNSIGPEKLTDEVSQVIVERALDILG